MSSDLLPITGGDRLMLADEWSAMRLLCRRAVISIAAPSNNAATSTTATVY